MSSSAELSVVDHAPCLMPLLPQSECVLVQNLEDALFPTRLWADEDHVVFLHACQVFLVPQEQSHQCRWVVLCWVKDEAKPIYRLAERSCAVLRL